MLQCPICTVIPATCLTQDGLPAYLVKAGWYWCTANNLRVKPIVIDDSLAHQPVEAAQEE